MAAEPALVASGMCPRSPSRLRGCGRHSSSSASHARPPIISARPERNASRKRGRPPVPRDVGASPSVFVRSRPSGLPIQRPLQGPFDLPCPRNRGQILDHSKLASRPVKAFDAVTSRAREPDARSAARYRCGFLAFELERTGRSYEITYRLAHRFARKPCRAGRPTGSGGGVHRAPRHSWFCAPRFTRPLPSNPGPRAQSARRRRRPVLPGRGSRAARTARSRRPRAHRYPHKPSCVRELRRPADASHDPGLSSK